MPKKGGGSVNDFFQSPLNIVFLIIILVIIAIFLYYVYIWWLRQKDVVKPIASTSDNKQKSASVPTTIKENFFFSMKK